MIKCTLLAASQWAILDKFTNLLSLYNILEAFNVSNFPTNLPEVTAISFIERSLQDPEEIEIVAKVCVWEKVIQEQPVKVNFNGKLKHKRLHKINGIKVEEWSKELSISIYHNNEEINRYKIDIFHKPKN